MSIDVMKVVWDTSKHKNSRLLAMLCFADHADDDGISWPGIAKLAKRCRLSENRVVKMVPELEDSREVYVNHGGGAGKSNRYFVTLGKAEAEIAKVLVTRMDKGNAEAATIARWIVSGEGARPLVVKKSRRHTPVTIRNDGRFANVIDEKNDGKNAEETMADLQGTMAGLPTEPSKNHHENHQFKEEETTSQPPARSQNHQPPAAPAQEPAPVKAKSKRRKAKAPVERPAAVHTYRAVFLRYPTKPTWKTLDDAVGDDPAKLDKWRAACEAWSLQQNKPTNLRGILDWFEKGIPVYAKNGGPNGTANGNGSQRQTSIPGLRKTDSGVEKRANIATGETYYVSRATGERVPAPD